MDSMNLFSVLTVSIPEAILDIFIGLLVIGQKNKLYLSKYNFTRFILAVLLMAILTTATRALVPIGLLSLIVLIILTVPIFKYCFNLKIGQSIISTLFFIGCLITIESLLMPSILTYLNKNVYYVFGNDIFRLICSIPVRVIQIYIIISIWNLRSIPIDFTKYRKLKNSFNIILVLLYSGEMIYLFTFVSKLDILDNISKVIYFMGFIMFIVANSLLFRFITMLSSTAKKSEIEKINKHTKELKEINSILEDVM